MNLRMVLQDRGDHWIFNAYKDDELVIARNILTDDQEDAEAQSKQLVQEYRLHETAAPGGETD